MKWTNIDIGAGCYYVYGGPNRGALVANARYWPFSSLRFYEKGESVCLPVAAMEA